MPPTRQLIYDFYRRVGGQNELIWVRDKIFKTFKHSYNNQFTLYNVQNDRNQLRDISKTAEGAEVLQQHKEIFEQYRDLEDAAFIRTAEDQRYLDSCYTGTC